MAESFTVMSKISDKLAFAAQYHEDIRLLGSSHVNGNPALVVRDGDGEDHILTLTPKKNR